MHFSWLQPVINQVIIWSIALPCAVAVAYLVVSWTAYMRENYPDLQPLVFSWFH